MNTTTTGCINCGEIVSSPFCPECGQRNPPKKLSLVNLYTDFQSRIYGFDGMFPRTLRDLIIRPGSVALSYIKGNRTRYVGPVGYFFLALTMSLLLMELLGLDMYALTTTDNPLNIPSSGRDEAFQKLFADIMGKHMRMFSFLMIPVSSMFAWIFFRKDEYNFLEHSILVFYVAGQIVWLSTINLLMIKFAGKNFNLTQLGLQIILYAFGCVGLYAAQGKMWAFVKGVLVSILSYLMYIILIGTFVVVFILNDPELMRSLEQIKPN